MDKAVNPPGKTTRRYHKSGHIPIKLCIVLDHFPSCNGAFFQAMLLAREIKTLGGEVFFVSYMIQGKSGPPCAFEASKIKVDHQEMYSISSGVFNKWKAIGLYVKLFFNLRKKYDQVLIQGLPRGIFWMLPVLKILGKKVFVRLTGLNINDPAKVRRSSWGFLKNLTLLLADRHINPSLAMEKAYRRSSIMPSKSVRIPNGVDTERFHPLTEDERIRLRTKLGYSPQDRIVLYVGTIRREKGIDLLLDAWDRVLVAVPHATLVLIGPLCPVCSSLKAYDKEFLDYIRPKVGVFVQGKKVLILQNKKNRIQFPGVVDRVERYYQVAEVFAFPSRREGMPNVVMEAMASGVPIVANDIEEITGELIQNEQEGTVVAGENVDAFAEAIIKLLNHSEKRQRIAETVRKKMEDNFSSSQFVKRYCELFTPG